MRAWLISVWLAAAACGRIDFDLGADGYFDPRWPYRMPLVIDHTMVGGSLTDFPVLVQLDDPDLAKAIGPDVRFTDAAGNLLAHELERLDGTALTAWVLVPAVSATVDTVLYLYYGNPAATDVQEPAMVWAGYAGVYHFGQTEPLDVRDASGRNPGTNGGVKSTAGKILGGALFGGAPGELVSAGRVGVDTSNGGFNTVSFWVNYTLPYGNAPFAFVDGVNGYDLWMESAACFGFNTQNGDVVGVPATMLVSRWMYVQAVFFNGVPNVTDNQLWIDGTRRTLTNCVGTPTARSAGDMLWGSADSYELTGLLDEARVVAGVRSPAWLVTEYRNQAQPGAFVVAGDEERAF